MLGDVCVHTAVPLTTADSTDPDTWIEGEPDEVGPVPGQPFDCFYYEPGSTEQATPVGGRKVKGPTMLLEAERDDGSLVELKAEDEVVVDAPEILGTGIVCIPPGVPVTGHLFQVDGDPTPLAPPGDIIGWEVRLKKVTGA